MLIHLAIYVLVLLLFIDHSGAYNFQFGSNNQVMWASGCDFNGNDIIQVTSAASDCGGICTNNSDCDHFTWSSSNCHLKQASNPTPTDCGFGCVCGFVINRSPASNFKYGNSSYSLAFALNSDLLTLQAQVSGIKY